MVSVPNSFLFLILCRRVACRESYLERKTELLNCKKFAGKRAILPCNRPKKLKWNKVVHLNRNGNIPTLETHLTHLAANPRLGKNLFIYALLFCFKTIKDTKTRKHKYLIKNTRTLLHLFRCNAKNRSFFLFIARGFPS